MAAAATPPLRWPAKAARSWRTATASISAPQAAAPAVQLLSAVMRVCRPGGTIGFTSFAPPVTNLAMPVIGPIMGLVSPELLLVPALLLLAVVVGFIPAMAAYRTDVAKSLGS